MSEFGKRRKYILLARFRFEVICGENDGPEPAHRALDPRIGSAERQT